MAHLTFSPVAAVVVLLAIFPLDTCAQTKKKPSDNPLFVARTLSGKEVRGELAEIGQGWLVRLSKGGVKRRITGDDLLTIRQEKMALPPLPADEHLVLANGDRLPVQDLRMENEKVYFRHPDLASGKETSLPLSAVVLYWRNAPERTAEPELFRRRLAQGKRSRDVVLFRNGDRLEGTLNAISGTQVEVERGKKKSSAKLAQVAVIALNTELTERLTPKGLHARVVLTETGKSAGGRLTLTAATCDGTTLRGKTVFGAFVRVAVERVAALEFAGGKAVALSDKKPSKYVYRPFLDETWPWAADATVTGKDMRLGGSTYDRGVGMHAHSVLTYRLDGAYRRLEALVGLDDRDGRKGRVVLRVLGDGKELDIGAKKDLTRAGGPQRISVNVEKVKELTLEVAGADQGPIQAVVNWAEARLVKKED